MDCADCVVKVGRALAQLSSVTPINVDYFSGLAELQYDAEAITPAAIIAYVARATGFGVRALTATSGSGAAAIVTLPLSFSTMPPPEALDGFDTRFGSNPHVIEVSFPVHIDSPHRPRDVFEQFKAFGAELVPAGSDGHHDMATHDLIVVGIRTIACGVLSIPVLVLAWANLPYRPVLYNSISVGFTTLIQGVAFPIISSAYRSIVYLHQADMSVLVAISTLTAYIFSVVSYAFEVAGRPFSPPFFETSALLITLIFLGRTVSAATRRSTGSALRELHRLQQASVILLSDEKGAPPQSLDSRLIYYGDIIRIPPETRIVTDGLVVSGSSDADESSLTGESVAVPKQKGSRVIAGTLNLGGTLDVQVTQLIHENSLSRITALVKQAQSSRSPAQDLANKLSAIILPVAAFSACIAFLVWVIVNRYVFHYSATTSSVEALTYAIAILVVSCPCAIGLVIPMVTSVAIRIGIREGVLFRSADALQRAHDIDVIAFDKTGTLTQGYFTTEHVEILVEGAEQIVNELIKDNKHPVSQGVHRYVTAHLAAAATQHRGGTVTDIVSLPGKGIKASVCGFPLLGGNPTFTGACSHPLSSKLQSSGLTLFTVTLAGQPIAFFGLADTPRPEANALVVELTRRGKDVMIFSGDTTAAVHHLANTIGIPLDKTFASFTPEDKDAAIAALQAKGQRVCFVGDGTNDGPALSRADVALAIAAGSDVALTAAGAVLLGSDLHRGILALLDIATAVRMHAYWALAWCIFYNIFAILFASGALIKVRIEPRWAGIGEIVSVLPVVAIGFGLDVRWAWRKSRLGMRGNN
ncbi:heavy metal translocatin [Suillus clintonianus]|uniref:heavy metal translocatin n=1 Tax=Suillus clintonianus TaxID=1904413 RepID=UPI001B871481|nr:heavy metal translocatin [Suillus clintonianus]KAG2144603.1 heavy metal translocatin [Suillus clintonianus]